jgi:hypothetical protein
MLPAVGDLPVQLKQEGSFVVPFSASLPGTPAYFKVFIVLSDYAVENAEAPDGALDPAAFARYVASRYAKVDLLMALAYLNHCLLQSSLMFDAMTLARIADVRPQTAHELLAISGVTSAKAGRFGDEVLALVSAHLND